MRVKANKNSLDVFIDKNDTCFECKNNTDCPLIEALRSESVILRYEEIEIQKCNLLKKKEVTIK